MNNAKARIIFENLENENFSLSEKIEACHVISNMPTMNSINKQMLRDALKFSLQISENWLELINKCLTSILDCIIETADKEIAEKKKCMNSESWTYWSGYIGAWIFLKFSLPTAEDIIRNAIEGNKNA